MRQLTLAPDVHAEPPPSATDDWFTPLSLWEPLHREFGFTVDVSPHPEAPVTRAIGKHLAEGIWTEWTGRVWNNPPFSQCGAWAEKALREIGREGGPEFVVQLMPATRTDQRWWAECIEPYRDWPHRRAPFRLATRFLEKRPRFGFPGDPSGEHSVCPRFGCVLLVWERRGGPHV